MKKIDTPLSLSQRSKFRKHLQQGDITAIASIAHVNRMTVTRWFDDKSNNMTVQESVIQLFKKRALHISKTINELMS